MKKILTLSGLVVFYIMLCTLPVQAQQWSSILAPARAIDWSQAGVTGGIPARTTICSTLNPGATAAQINSAIANCASGQVVQLNAGTYNLGGGITFNGRSNVTLRGAGPDQTFLVFSNDTSCQGQFSNICIMGNDLGYYGPGPPAVAVNWTAGYSKGTTVITLSATTGLSVGMYLVLDQLNDASDTGNIFVCVAQTTCTDEGGGGNARTNRVQRQMVNVTNISGNNVTITPGLYMPNWSSGKTPQAWWGNSGSLSHGNGIEDLSVDGLNSGAGAANITLMMTYDSWVKNVRSAFAPTPRAHIMVYQAAHCTVRDSYLFGSVSETSGPTHYGIETFGTADIRVENNIIHRRTTPLISDGDTGSVFAYNFTINDQYSVPSFMQASNYSHEGGNGMILHEGNQAIGIKGDIIHGTSNLFTFFRNYSIGWENGKDAATNPVALYAFNRYWAFIGNVLGQTGYHTTYQGTSSTSTIWGLGLAANLIGSDPVTATTSMRWGNYDTVSAASRFVASEVPSGLANFPNPIPGITTLPASFYLSAKPSFFGSIAWPPIGPDVSGATGPGGHVIRIPARVCFEDVMGGTAADSTPRTFNANICYGTGGGGGDKTPPNAPQNLSVL